jgi:hypothetical protein
MLSVIANGVEYHFDQLEIRKVLATGQTLSFEFSEQSLNISRLVEGEEPELVSISGYGFFGTPDVGPSLEEVLAEIEELEAVLPVREVFFDLITTEDVPKVRKPRHKKLEGSDDNSNRPGTVS